MTRVAIATMGCKVNAYDSAHLRGRMAGRAEFVPLEGNPEVVVINTCSVTNKSDADARNLIRKTRRSNPGAVMVVTGCYAQANPSGIAAIEGVDYVFGSAEKGLAAEYFVAGRLGRRASPLVVVGDLSGVKEVRHTEAGRFDGHTRAYLKVQEGCDYRCTYCIIPQTRGGVSRSVPLARALAEARSLAALGYRELVLTGVHIGSWGREEGLELADLVEAVASLDGIARVRISSIDSPELRPRLVELVAGHPCVARHLHVPIQSANDATLARMGRVYTLREYRKAIENAVARCSDLCVGTDVIVGFPGETDLAFRETAVNLAALPIHHFHVFSFSPRDGTPAAFMEGAVTGDRVRERSRELRALSAEKLARWASGFTGRRFDVLFEHTPPGAAPRGRTAHYLDVSVPGLQSSPGEIRTIEITSTDSFGRAAGREVTA